MRVGLPVAMVIGAALTLVSTALSVDGAEGTPPSRAHGLGGAIMFLLGAAWAHWKLSRLVTVFRTGMSLVIARGSVTVTANLDELSRVEWVQKAQGSYLPIAAIQFRQANALGDEVQYIPSHVRYTDQLIQDLHEKL